MDGDIMQAIVYDVAAEREPAESKLKYTSEMLEFRSKIEAEWNAYRKNHPNAELYVPPELPSVDTRQDFDPDQPRDEGGRWGEGGGGKPATAYNMPDPHVATRAMRDKVSDARRSQDLAAVKAIHKELVEAAATNPSLAGDVEDSRKEIAVLEAAGRRAPPVPVKEYESERKAHSSKLSTEERQASVTYTTADYRAINDALRNGGSHEVVAHLDAAIAKAPATRDMTVYRGVSGRGREAIKALQPGDIFEDKAYVSTGSQHATWTNDEDENVLMYINVPKGYPAAPVQGKYDVEREYLLPRGTKLRIDHIERHPKNKESMRVFTSVVRDGKAG